LVWGDSDVTGISPCDPNDPGEYARWTIKKMGSWQVVASGNAVCPGWNGVNDVAVPADTTSYLVLIDWWDSWAEDYTQTAFSNVNVTPGQVHQFSY
jgi:hypothetical protein